MFEHPKKIETVQRKPENKTGMPDSLKSGIETLSGMSMDSVRVHYNSSEPARLGALAYTMGNDIHISSGMERHLPHEAWHVVQQMRGFVRPTVKIDGTAVNDEPRLEKEADIMGNRAAQMKTAQCFGLGESMGGKVAQCYKLPAGRNFSSVSRDDFQPANGDGLGDTETLSVKDKDNKQISVTTQRDHIIPMKLIRQFADEVFHMVTAETHDDCADNWLKYAVGNFWGRGKNKSDKPFYQTDNGEKLTRDYDDDTRRSPTVDKYIDNNTLPSNFTHADMELIILKSIAWMPANIFMAPKGKEGDDGDKLDRTAYTVSDLPFADFKTAYENMDAFVKAGNKSEPDIEGKKDTALDKLAEIARLRSEPWPFNPSEWIFEGGKIKAKNIEPHP